MNVDLDSIAFSSGDSSTDIRYRRFSADISTAMSVLAQQWRDDLGVLGISNKAGPYLHWVLSCAATALKIPTLAMRAEQSIYHDIVVAGPIDLARPGLNILFDHAMLAEMSSVVDDGGQGFNAFASALIRNPAVINRVILTSGSTGTHKAVPITNEILLRRKTSYLERVDLAGRDYALATVGYDTAGGYCYPIYALLTGACVVINRSSPTQSVDFSQLLSRLVAQSAYLYTTPAVLREILRISNGEIMPGRAT